MQPARLVGLSISELDAKIDRDEARHRDIEGRLAQLQRGFMEPDARLLIHNLERLAAGEIDRLAVFMPPGSAKSTYSSILFPPWFLAQKPKASILAASHTTELAEKWGRRVRNLVTEHGWAQQIHPGHPQSTTGLRASFRPWIGIRLR